MAMEGGKPLSMSAEGIELGETPLKWVSPDGKLVFAHSPARGPLLYPIDGRPDSSPLPIAGLAEDDAPIGWTADSQSLFVQRDGDDPARTYRLNWTSGKKEFFRDFRPSDLTGIAMSWVLVTPDEKTCVYSYIRRLSELYLVEGMR
jgi:hypothetical protein